MLSKKKKKKKVSESESSQEIDSNSQSELRQSISDAAWGQFCFIVAYKAENAGKLLVKVDPRNTSKMCSGCGELKDMPLKERRYQCSHCGLDLDRDHNAALNIKKSGLGFVEDFLNKNPKQKPPPQLPFGQ